MTTLVPENDSQWPSHGYLEGLPSVKVMQRLKGVGEEGRVEGARSAPSEGKGRGWCRQRRQQDGQVASEGVQAVSEGI